MKTNCHGCASENLNSDCCEGTTILTPQPTANRPGLSALSYRIGTHASFLETMKARLASNDFPELADLSARDSNDPSLALLDAWAAVADVLSFYQERIANEGYLRTATERRSVLELGRLVGYKMRPGVSSSVFLAYTLDPNTKEEVVIPAGSRAQSVPGKDELPQTFESSEDLKAHSGWNDLRPRMTQPQTEATIEEKNQVYLKGINTNLKPNDPLLIDFGVSDGTPKLHWIKEVKPDAAADRTLIKLTPEQTQTNNRIITGTTELPIEVPTVRLIKDLTLRHSLQPTSTLYMRRKTGEQFAEKADAGYRTLISAVPLLRETLTPATANAGISSKKKIKIYALRKKVAPFGHNAPLQPIGMDGHHVMNYKEWHIENPIAEVTVPKASFKIKVLDKYTLTANFVNDSTGKIDTAIWFFDDGPPVTLTDPNFVLSEQIHKYPNKHNGTKTDYTVRLQVSGPGGTATYAEKITITNSIEYIP